MGSPQLLLHLFIVQVQPDSQCEKGRCHQQHHLAGFCIHLLLPLSQLLSVYNRADVVAPKPHGHVIAKLLLLTHLENEVSRLLSLDIFPDFLFVSFNKFILFEFIPRIFLGKRAFLLPQNVISLGIDNLNVYIAACLPL